MPKCSVPDCGRENFAAGLCTAHYQRQRRGEPLTGPVRDRRAEAGLPVTADVSPSTLEKLSKEAAAAGVSVRAFVRELLEAWAKGLQK